MELPLLPLVLLSLTLFSIGALGILLIRHPLVLVLSIELLLNGANLLFVSFGHFWGNEIGMAWVFFVLFIAAIEGALGLAILIRMFRTTPEADIDQYNTLGAMQ